MLDLLAGLLLGVGAVAFAALSVWVQAEMWKRRRDVWKRCDMWAARRLTAKEKMRKWMKKKGWL